MNNRHPFLLLVLLTLPLFVQGVFDHPLWLNDEGHVAEIGREMYLSGDVVVPRLDGEPFLEKPPLYFMVMSLSYRCFGITPGAARLPSAIFGFLTVLVVYAIGAAQGCRRLGLLAAFLLATTSMIFRFSHWCVVDSAVCFFTTLAYYTFLRAYHATTRKLGWYLAFYVAFALAFMSKGLIAPVMIGVAICALLLWENNVRELRYMGLWAGLPLVVLIIGPWLYLLWDVGGTDLFRNFLIDNNLGRFSATISQRYPEHTRSFFYYFGDFQGNFLPWTPLLFPALFWGFWQTRTPSTPTRTLYRFLLAGFFMNLLLFSFSTTKRGVYILPLYPLVTVCVGGWLAELLDGRKPMKGERFFLWLQVGLLALTPLLILVGLWIYAPKPHSLILILLGLVFLGFIIFTRWAYRAHRIWLAIITLGVQTVLTYSVVVWLVFPVISPHKHFVDYFEQLAKQLQPGDFIATFRGIHEANLGQACITLNRRIPDIKDPRRIATILNQQSRRVFVLVEGWHYDELKPLLPTHLAVFCSQSMEDPLSHSKKWVLRCFTNVSGDRRPALFQDVEISPSTISALLKKATNPIALPGAP